MIYGSAWLAFLALVSGQAFTFDSRAPYVLSLLGLAVFASVVAFACYVTLLGRIGPGRAAYAMVMFPVGALALSWAFEGYQWTVPATIGVGLTIVGNLFALKRS